VQQEAARPKKLRVQDQESTTQESMLGSQPSVRRNPSTDQKKTRRQMQRAQKTACAACQRPSAGPCDTCGCTLVVQATVLPTNAEGLQQGHVLRLPSGQRVKVKSLRPHENSRDHMYLDTDIGTAVVHRKAPFNVMTGDAASRGVPFKQPGNRETPGNFNTELGESTDRQQAPAAAGKCPNCGKGPLVNHGGKMRCRNCGYASSGGDSDFGEPGYRRPATSAYQHDGRSAIARRAQSLVERTKQ